MKESKNNHTPTLKKIWKFIWEDDSIWSWIVNVILAYVLIKFIVYPGLGFALSTSHPIVAVVSGSMEHDGTYEQWWQSQEEWYTQNGISMEQFQSYPFTNGFNKGDIMILKGKKPEDIKKGDVLVFKSHRPDPIIHRVVARYEDQGELYFQTKGDHNSDSISSGSLDETKIAVKDTIGIAIIRIPLLGYIKIWFVALLQYIGIAR